ncbi:unnamed protein product [Rotaria sordida]|uniref:MGS-like domain-containing protein n=1 Tax=Rotaria sordida TaxID=392033 RepID=A0A813V879_9BILA|nr:unnamed protein product [Rotaria sordida]CAF3975612.1 unnamed protein product [Rotaria sordida]
MERNEVGFQSKGQIIDYFQAVTRFNFEDSVRILNQHKWNLNSAVQEFFSRNDRERNLTNGGYQQLTSLLIRQENDQHLAELVHDLENGSNVQKDVSNLIVMGEHKRIALVAHNNKKTELIECLRQHRDVLAKHKLYGTGTTGSLVEKELRIPVTKFESGPLGGDQQIGAKITLRELDVLIFFIDPLDSHPHTADVQALLRLAQVYGIVCATTPATVDFLLTSKMMDKTHTRRIQLSQPSKPN